MHMFFNSLWILSFISYFWNYCCSNLLIFKYNSLFLWTSMRVILWMALGNPPCLWILELFALLVMYIAISIRTWYVRYFIPIICLLTLFIMHLTIDPAFPIIKKTKKKANIFVLVRVFEMFAPDSSLTFCLRWWH